MFHMYILLTIYHWKLSNLICGHTSSCSPPSLVRVTVRSWNAKSDVRIWPSSHVRVHLKSICIADHFWISWFDLLLSKPNWVLPKPTASGPASTFHKPCLSVIFWSTYNQSTVKGPASWTSKYKLSSLPTVISAAYPTEEPKPTTT